MFFTQFDFDRLVMAATVLFALSPSAWEYSIQGDVFALARHFSQEFR
jgi:hypothetical protein